MKVFENKSSLLRVSCQKKKKASQNKRDWKEVTTGQEQRNSAMNAVPEERHRKTWRNIGRNTQHFISLAKASRTHSGYKS